MRTAIFCLLLLAPGTPGMSETTRFQNGASPQPQYAGCVDTRISVYNDAEAREGRDGKSAELRTFDKARRILVRFDLSAIPKDHVVTAAALRVYCIRPTRMDSFMQAALLTHEWDETASGFEFKKTDDDKGPEGNWAAKGGDFDDQAVLKAPLAAGRFGHAFEVNATDWVRDWVAGKKPNHGVILWSCPHTEHAIASSEWAVVAYRPELVVEHAPAGQAGPSALAPLPKPTKDVALSPVAQTPDAGKAQGEYGVIRIGEHAHATVVGAFSDSYLKTWPKLAESAWGWMPMLRVGGGAGNFSATLLSVDLKAVPKGASVRSAKLRLCVVDPRSSAGTRFGVYAARKDAPRWDAAAMTLSQAGPQATWGKVGYRAAFEDSPVAVAMLTPAKDAQADTWIEWDLTGAVRAALPDKGILNLLVSHDVEGGAFDAYSSRYDDFARRPCLEIEASPPPTSAIGQRPALPEVLPGDYWVEPMKAVHKQFHGTSATLGQYGDSITITMAFLAPHSYGSVMPDKCPDAVKERLKIVEGYANRKLWNQWKDPKYGNNGSMTIHWAYNNVETWQQTCKPEVAVILFGTNDVGAGPLPPDHTEQYAYVVDCLLADGTIPIITTLPTHGGQKTNPDIVRRVTELRRAQLAVARARQVPVIDFYKEIVSRQPEDWDKTLMGDTLHPSFPKAYQKDFTEEGLKNSGYTLRNYLTLMMYADIIEKVLKS